MRVAPHELDALAQLVEDLCGVVLDQTKGYLVESRLSGMLAELGCSSYAELVARVRRGDEKWAQAQLIDAITTQETLFFRDGSPFEALNHKVLPELLDAKLRAGGPPRLRIWSAACSTGQEPYSLAMIVDDLLDGAPEWDVEILATDVSNAALTQASAGVFGSHEVRRGLSDEELARFMEPDGASWRVRSRIKERVTFKRLNLLDPFTGLGEFDVILCRNVAIYFRAEARDDLYRRLMRQLAQGGYIFTSSSESLFDVDPAFVPEHHCRSVFYRPNGKH